MKNASEKTSNNREFKLVAATGILIKDIFGSYTLCIQKVLYDSEAVITQLCLVRGQLLIIIFMMCFMLQVWHCTFSRLWGLPQSLDYTRGASVRVCWYWPKQIHEALVHWVSRQLRPKICLFGSEAFFAILRAAYSNFNWVLYVAVGPTNVDSAMSTTPS